MVVWHTRGGTDVKYLYHAYCIYTTFNVMTLCVFIRRPRNKVVRLSWSSLLYLQYILYAYVGSMQCTISALTREEVVCRLYFFFYRHYFTSCEKTWSRGPIETIMYRYRRDGDVDIAQLPDSSCTYLHNTLC